LSLISRQNEQIVRKLASRAQPSKEEILRNRYKRLEKHSRNMKSRLYEAAKDSIA
jgi:hypothetical protein